MPAPMNTPQQLSIDEWKAIMLIPAIREAWGIEENETPEQFADMVYGVKFTFSPSMAQVSRAPINLVNHHASGASVL